MQRFSSIEHVAQAPRQGVVSSAAHDNKEVNLALRSSLRPRSECLSNGDEVLPCFDSRRSIQVVTEVHADWAYRSGVAESQSNGIGVLTVKTDITKDVPAVIEGNYPESLLQRHRNAELGVDQEQLIAANPDRDLRARARTVGIAASRNHALWARAIQRESAQSIAATAEELLAEGDMPAERLRESEAHAVGPHDLLLSDALVIRGLSQELSKIEIR